MGEPGPEAPPSTLKAPLPDGNSLIVTARVEPGLAGELSNYGVTFSGAGNASAHTVNRSTAGVQQVTKLWYAKRRSRRLPA